MNELIGKYGIWGGRFQIIHKGHEYVLDYVAKHYSNVCIGIVNPNPKIPPCSVLEHEKFLPEKNPLTYFQRVYLWNRLLKHHSINAVIVPHWHPRKSLKLEGTFLPQPKGQREWIIPFLPGEEYKIQDFKDAGEIVRELHEIPNDIQVIHSSNIKRLFDEKNRSFKSGIPEELLKVTQQLLNGESINEKYIIVPILGDNIHPLLICGGIQLALETGYRIIFAPTVKVAKEKEWWNYTSDEQDYFTFYQKHEMINVIMQALNFYDYLVIPIIINNGICEIESFFPESNFRAWFFVNEINTNTVFKQFRYEEIMTIKKDKISDEVLILVYNLRIGLFKNHHYYDNYFSENESEVTAMNNNNFYGPTKGNQQINVFNEKVLDGVHQHNNNKDSAPESLAEGIVLILNKDENDDIQKLIKKTDALLQKETEEQGVKVIEETVKSQVDSNKKKKAVIEKLKSFAVKAGESIIIGLLLKAVNALVFGI